MTQKVIIFGNNKKFIILLLNNELVVFDYLKIEVNEEPVELIATGSKKIKKIISLLKQGE